MKKNKKEIASFNRLNYWCQKRSDWIGCLKDNNLSGNLDQLKKNLWKNSWVYIKIMGPLIPKVQKDNLNFNKKKEWQCNNKTRPIIMIKIKISFCKNNTEYTVMVFFQEKKKIAEFIQIKNKMRWLYNN